MSSATPPSTTPLPVERQGRVILGLDGSSGSVAALRWAAAQARRRDWCLDVVVCWPDHEVLFVHEVPGFCAPRNRAVEALRRALLETGEDCAGVVLRTFVENAHPVEALVGRCTGHDLLVVGASTHDRVGIDELCAMLAPCAVVVVDAETRARTHG